MLNMENGYVAPETKNDPFKEDRTRPLNMENAHVTPETKNDLFEYNLSALTDLNEVELLCPIKYLYNYFPHHPRWLKLQPISLSRFSECKSPSVDHQSKRDNSIRLHTQAANLALHTGLEDFRQNKHWRSCAEAITELLQLFAKDQRCGEVFLSHKASMSSLAGSQLMTAASEACLQFCILMFAEADEDRIRLIGQCCIMLFIFDGAQNLSHQIPAWAI